jgi:phosphoribosylaminoimidazole (AIR) synthetase
MPEKDATTYLSTMHEQGEGAWVIGRVKAFEGVAIKVH